MHNLFIFLLLIFFQFSGFGQNNIAFIDSIADKVCDDLQYNSHIESLEHHDFKQILRTRISKYQDEWTRELNEIGNPGNFKYNELDYLLQHRLLQTCNRFRVLDNNYQMRVITDVDYKKPYITLKDFVLDAESGINPENLTKYFSPEIGGIELIEQIRLLQLELQKYKKTSGMFINIRGNQLYYYINFFDYTTGDDNLAIKILFNDTKDNLIDKWDFTTKEDLKKVEEEELNKDIDEELLEKMKKGIKLN